ncbi:hypothetical protein BDW62DRAFT_194606 [Aspergillus aurantiobrunneus]
MMGRNPGMPIDRSGAAGSPTWAESPTLCLRSWWLSCKCRRRECYFLRFGVCAVAGLFEILFSTFAYSFLSGCSSNLRFRCFALRYQYGRQVFCGVKRGGLPVFGTCFHVNKIVSQRELGEISRRFDLICSPTICAYIQAPVI